MKNVLSNEYDLCMNSVLIGSSIVILNLNCHDCTFCEVVNELTVTFVTAL